jgi:MFS family permease
LITKGDDGEMDPRQVYPFPVFWVVAVYCLAAMQFVLAARSIAERRPVGVLSRRAKNQDFRVWAVSQVAVGACLACLVTHDLTQRFVWMQVGGICLGVGLVALIGTGLWEYRTDRRH